MSFTFGQVDEFTDPAIAGDPVIAVVARMIELGPFKGAFYQAMAALQIPLTQKEFDVYSRSKTSRDGIIGDGSGETGGWDADDTTGLKMPAGACVGLTVGHVLKVENEIVIVKSVSRSANTIDVWARGAGASTAAAHADETAFKVIGFAGSDIDLKNVESISETTSAWSNYVQTIFETCDWTKHAELTKKGISPEQATLIIVKEAQQRVAEMLARMAILGVKQAAVSGGNRSMSAGLFAQLAETNGGKRPVLSYNANSAALTETIMHNALTELFKNGKADTIWCSNKNKKIINTFNMANTSLTVGTNRTDHTAGTYISDIDYEGAIIKVRVDTDMPDDKVAIVTQSKCKKGWLQGDELTLKDEPSASSREFKKSVQGSVGFLIEDVGFDHTYIYGLV